MVVIADQVKLKNAAGTVADFPLVLTAGGGLKVGLVDSIPAGSANIGDVDVLTYPGPSSGQLPAALVSSRLDVNLGAAPASITVGTLPSIPAGTNNIGDVDIVSMPSVVIASGTITTVSTVTNLSQMSGAAISMNTGVRDAGTQRVTIATNDVVPASQSGTWNIGTVTTVSTVTNLSQMSGAAISMNTGVRDAGTQRVTIATNDVVPASQSGTWNIGTVTTVSTVTSLTQMNGQAISMGTGVRDAGTQRVTIATNDLVPVSDNGGSLTVDAPVGTPVFVRLSDGTSAIATLPVSLASVPSHAVTNAGTFAVQVDGSALTALQLIDDIVHADAATLSKVAAMGGQYDDTSPGAVTEDKIHPNRINKTRALGVGPLHLQTADLSNVNTTYNNTTTSANSQDIDCDGYSRFSLSLSLTSATTPTDIQFIIQFKDADGVYMAYQNDFWGRLKIEDTEVASQKDYVWGGTIPAGFKTMRLRVVATGTDATKTFTVADAKIGLATV